MAAPNRLSPPRHRAAAATDPSAAAVNREAGCGGGGRDNSAGGDRAVVVVVPAGGGVFCGVGTSSPARVPMSLAEAEAAADGAAAAAAEMADDRGMCAAAGAQVAAGVAPHPLSDCVGAMVRGNGRAHRRLPTALLT